MEIRPAKPTDFPDAQNLMKEVFDDTDRFISLFFKYLIHDNLLLGLKNGKAVSMAFQLPAKMRVHDEMVEATYLYACATTESERGKGWMREIINRAWEESRKKKEIGIFLLPASESLYTYYEQLGFNNFFYLNNEFFHTDASFLKIIPEYTLLPISADQYALLRHKLLKSEYTIHYPINFFRFIEAENENPEAGFYQILNPEKQMAIAYLRKDQKRIIVEELLGVSELKPLADFLAHQFNVSSVTIKTPGISTKSAMLLPTEEYLFLLKEKGYFNWSLG